MHKSQRTNAYTLIIDKGGKKKTPVNAYVVIRNTLPRNNKKLKIIKSNSFPDIGPVLFRST